MDEALTDGERIRRFEVATGVEVADPTRKLPNHHRIIHPAGAAGFTDENLARLAQVFTSTTGH